MTKGSQILFSLLRTFQRRVLPLAISCVLPVLAVKPAQTQTYTVIHNFTGGGDGGSPQAGLTLGGTATLYGTTLAGGGIEGDGCFPLSDGCGLVFKIALENGGWVLTPLYPFPGSVNGREPQAPVLFGPGGLLYGSTFTGGLDPQDCFLGGCGVVFTLHPPATTCHAVLCYWIENPIYQFTTLTDGFAPSGNLAFDQAGNVYGTTVYGGTGCLSGCGIVFQLTRSGSGWTKTTIHNFTGGNYVIPTGVIIDPFGSLYGTTVYGGLFDKGFVFQLTPSGSGWTFSRLYDFRNGDDGGSPQGGLVMDAVGNLYGTTGTGGAGHGGTVFELSPSGGGWTFSVIASFTGNHGSVGNLAFDSAGNLYGTTLDDGAFGFGNVFKLTPSGGQWTYNDLYDFTGGDDGGEPDAGVTLDSSGNIFGIALYGPRQGCRIQGNPGCGVIWEITP